MDNVHFDNLYNNTTPRYGILEPMMDNDGLWRMDNVWIMDSVHFDKLYNNTQAWIMDNAYWIIWIGLEI